MAKEIYLSRPKQGEELKQHRNKYAGDDKEVTEKTLLYIHGPYNQRFSKGMIFVFEDKRWELVQDATIHVKYKVLAEFTQLS